MTNISYQENLREFGFTLEPAESPHYETWSAFEHKIQVSPVRNTDNSAHNYKLIARKDSKDRIISRYKTLGGLCKKLTLLGYKRIQDIELTTMFEVCKTIPEGVTTL